MYYQCISPCCLFYVFHRVVLWHIHWTPAWCSLRFCTVFGCSGLVVCYMYRVKTIDTVPLLSHFPTDQELLKCSYQLKLCLPPSRTICVSSPLHLVFLSSSHLLLQPYSSSSPTPLFISSHPCLLVLLPTIHPPWHQTHVLSHQSPCSLTQAILPLYF